MTVAIEELTDVTDEVVEAFSRLLPQLSTSAKPLDAAAIRTVVSSPSVTVLLARDEGKIIGSLSLVVFRIPTAVRAWVEDVVVDQAAGRKGTGTALVQEAVERAKAAGARTVDLTTRPARVAAGNLYEKVGFQQRDTRVYRYSFE
ncbi:MAG TPA: GNAT family N-acetyltransferase [Streptosporangiaceae bacterium]|nr:GNAT family N-acetyltransferase [Streptosporangiaceae bacterium]